MLPPMQVLWRLRSSSGQVKECHLIEHSLTACEVRIVYSQQDVARFTDTKAARNSAALLEGALRADGWTDVA